VILTEGGIVRSTGKGKNHYQTNITLSGGGILMERGCHSLTQLTYMLQDYQLTVTGANILWHHQLDVDIDARLQASLDTNVEIEYHLSMIRPLKNLIKFVFETAEVTFDHTDPALPLHISTAKNHSLNFAIELNKSWALSPIQAFYLKWMHIVKLWKSGADIDTASETSLSTTMLINDIYEAGGA
jgi:predicted dehydrogenase